MAQSTLPDLSALTLSGPATSSGRDSARTPSGRRPASGQPFPAFPEAFLHVLRDLEMQVLAAGTDGRAHPEAATLVA